MEAKEVLSAQEAAEFLHFNPVTIRLKARLGEIPGHKIGKEWRFSRRRLLEWLEQRDWAAFYEQYKDNPEEIWGEPEQGPPTTERTAKLKPNLVCGNCRLVGAYDFTGEPLCQLCAAEDDSLLAAGLKRISR